MKKGTAELVVLHLLRSGRKYGYQIAQEISTRSQGLFTLQEGSLYPTLYRLEKNGYVAAQTEFSPNQQRIRKYYSITKEGDQYFQNIREEYRRVSEGIEKILQEDFPGV
jgi:PadR family transcriptional regulator PadR